MGSTLLSISRGLFSKRCLRLGAPTLSPGCKVRESKPSWREEHSFHVSRDDMAKFTRTWGEVRQCGREAMLSQKTSSAVVVERCCSQCPGQWSPSKS